MNVPGLVGQVFLLLTYGIVEGEWWRKGQRKTNPGDGGGGRYLSVGLCVALMWLEVSE